MCGYNFVWISSLFCVNFRQRLQGLQSVVNDFGAWSVLRKSCGKKTKQQNACEGPPEPLTPLQLMQESH